VITADMKRSLNMKGVWLREDQQIDSSGTITVMDGGRVSRRSGWKARQLHTRPGRSWFTNC
jgi:hypothetical protein